MKTFTSYLTLFRFELPFAAGVCVVLGQVLALGTLPPVNILLFGFGAVFFISASALILNDLFDIESDRINAAERPLPSGRVSPTGVVILFGIVSILGFVLSFLISISVFLLVVVLWIVALLYNWKFKRAGIAGNLMISFSVGMTFIYGGVSVGVPFDVLVWLFAVIAALINLGEEIAADVMDMHGDKKMDSKSVPIQYGAETAVNICTIIFGTAILISMVPFVFGLLPLMYIIPILIMDVIIVYSVMRFRKSKGQEGRRYIRMLYLGALFGMMVLLAMRLIAG